MPAGYSEPRGQRAAYVWDNGAEQKENKVLRIRQDGSPGDYPGQVLKEAGPDHGVWEDADNVRIEPGFRVVLRDRTADDGTGAGARTVLENRGRAPKTIDLKSGGYAVSNNGAGYIRVEKIGGRNDFGGGAVPGPGSGGGAGGAGTGADTGGAATAGASSLSLMLLVGALVYLLTK
jgi:hypothetical protein